MRAILRLKPNGRLSNFLNRITRKHLLILAFVLLGSLSLGLLVIVIIQAVIFNHTDTINNKQCLTEGCLSAATYQLNSRDDTDSIHACIDFYTYACKGWERSHPIQSFDVERTILGDLIDQRDMEIQRLLNEPIARLTPKSWEYKLKTYYSECLDDYARQSNSGKELINLIEDPTIINGWFVLDNNHKNDSQEYLLKYQNISTQMSIIHGDLGVPAAFDIRTRFDEIDSNVKRLEFFPAGLSLEIEDYLGNDTISEGRRTAYQIYITKVLTLLAQEAGVFDENLSHRILTVVNDVLTVEKSLAKPLRYYPGDPQPITMTFAQMSEEFSFNFLDLMKHELADASIVSNLTTVYITNSMYFTDAFRLFAKNPNPIFARMIHNYFRWRLLCTYIEDLSYHYLLAHREFLDQYSGKKLHSTNEEYCTREIRRKFPRAIQNLYRMNSTGYAERIAMIQAIFKGLKNGFREYIDQQATWMKDEMTKNLAREKIDALTIEIGYAMNDTRLDDYYEKLIVTDQSHFQNAFLYHRWQQYSLSMALIKPDILDHWDLFEERTSRLFDYIPLFNRLFVIASAVQEPLMHSKWPWPMNLGSIGVLFAQKLFASIDGPEGRTHLANGTRFDWWATPTVTGYATSRNCITDYYINQLQNITYCINNIPIEVPLAGEPFSPITLRHIGALHLAYNALKKYDQIKSFQMPGTNFSSEQTFFLAYAQTQCFQRQVLSQYTQTKSGLYDERTALNTALIHMPEFNQAFQCVSKANQCFN